MRRQHLPTNPDGRLRAGHLVRALAAVVLCLASSGTLAAAQPDEATEPRRWLIGYHKALFWMSEVELRFFYDIADAYTPRSPADPALGPTAGRPDLKLVAATPAPFGGRAWEVDFLMRRGRLAEIGLEHSQPASRPGDCTAEMRHLLAVLQDLHGPLSEAPRDGRATLTFRRGARWEVSTAYLDGQCHSRMDLRRAPPRRS